MLLDKAVAFFWSALESNRQTFCKFSYNLTSRGGVFSPGRDGFLIVWFVTAKYIESKMPALNISKKRKFVADGVFYSELNEVN